MNEVGTVAFQLDEWMNGWMNQVGITRFQLEEWTNASSWN